MTDELVVCNHAKSCGDSECVCSPNEASGGFMERKVQDTSNQRQRK